MCSCTAAMTNRSHLAWLIAGALISSCRSDPPPPEPVAKTPEKPKAPPPADVKPAAPVAEAEAMAKTLLGLNAKPQAALVAKPVKRRVPRKPRLAMPEEPDMSSYPPVLEPGLSDADFQQAIDEWGGFKNCLALAAYRNGRKAENGAVKVEFEIKQSGDVVRSRVKESKSPELAECIETRSKKLRFPAFAGIDRVTKEAKFLF